MKKEKIPSTITDFIKKHNIISHIGDLIELVGDKMSLSNRTLSSSLFGKVKNELELAQEITRISLLSMNVAERMLLVTERKFPTLPEVIKHVHERGEGWHVAFIVVKDKGTKRIATVRPYWNGGSFCIDWHWFDPSVEGKKSDYLLLASGI